MVQILQRMWNRLFGKSENNWCVEFQITHPVVLQKYHNSAHYFAEFILQANKPNGTKFFSGKEKENKIIVDYNVSMIQLEEIKNFILQSGVMVQEISRRPYKKFFGIEYISER